MKSTNCPRSVGHVNFVYLLEALVGLELVVELRNDLSIRGVLDECDNAMNVIMKEATIEDVEGIQTQLPLVFLRGSNIRFVHIPDNIDIVQAVEERRLLLDRAAHAYMGKGAPAPKPSSAVTGTPGLSAISTSYSSA